MTRGVQHGEVVKSAELEFTAWHVPGHTLGALCYSGHNLAFTGDTLFTGGCARLFEGAPAQMIHSLVEVIGALPSETELYTGHEYTASNLKFAQMVEGSNLDVRQRYASVAAAREHGAFTASASLKVELSTNPFLRCHVAEIRQHVGAPPEASLADVFALLRRAKDAF